MLRNTTNIPDRLVAIAAAFAIPPGCPTVSRITIKNKRHGKVMGQWGWFYPDDNHVIVIVPRKITRVHTIRLKFSKKETRISSRAEFLVRVLAHEMRHAWQYANWNTPSMKWRLERTRVGKYAREVDAELYEIDTIRRWRLEIVPRLAGVA